MRRALVALLLVAAATLAPAVDAVITPTEQRRGEDQTFLTFPEWYLVLAAAVLGGRDDSVGGGGQGGRGNEQQRNEGTPHTESLTKAISRLAEEIGRAHV